MNKQINWIFVLLLITAIFEKIQYSSFKLYTIIGFVFIGLMVVHSSTNTYKAEKVEVRLIFFKLTLFAIYCLQGIWVMVDGSSDIYDQYFKGFLTSGLYGITFDVMLILYLFHVSDLDIKRLFEKLIKIGSINIIYNLIQYVDKDIDSAIFIRFLHSDVIRYGTDVYGAGVGRLTGLFTDSNNNAAFLIIFFMIAFYLEKNTRGKKKIIYYVLMGVSALEIVLTYSRTGIIGLAICLLFIFFKEGLFRNWKLLLMILAGIALAIYTFRNNAIFNDLILARIRELGAGNSHIVAAENAIEIVKLSPIYILMGVGVNCLSVYYERLFGLVGFKAHSLYLQVFAEDGVIGLFVTLLFWVTIVIITLRAVKINKAFYVIPIIALSFLAMNITYDSAFQPICSWIIAIGVISYKEYLRGRRGINMK